MPGELVRLDGALRQLRGGAVACSSACPASRRSHPNRTEQQKC
jgi:hypothetical protein